MKEKNLIDILSQGVADCNDSYIAGFKSGCKISASFILAQSKKVVENSKHIIGGAEYLHIDTLEYLVNEIIGETV